MLHFALIFLMIALVAGLLGLGGVAGVSAGLAQGLFFLILGVLVVSLLISLFRRPTT